LEKPSAVKFDVIAIDGQILLIVPVIDSQRTRRLEVLRYADVAIVGGGLAGSIAANMLGRAKISAVLIDPHRVYPPEFRCEKISGGAQLDRFCKTGLADAVLPATTLDGVNWIARFGRLLDKRPSQQHGIMYDALVNTIRQQIPNDIDTLQTKAIAVTTSQERQTVSLSNGETVSARLVVLASGLNPGLRHALGIERRIISACHCISIGFDVVPIGRPSFDFPALTYFAERTIHRTAYITFFPIENAMRGNLFVYREVQDPWLREIRRSPEQALDACLPNLRRMIGDYKIVGDVKIRTTDLYVTSGHRRHGIVLVGDAFASPCPATGTGTDKVFTDVERLCNVHIPSWLRTEGMSETKIAQLYDDPIKKACDEWATHEAFRLRSMTIENSLFWLAQRWVRFLGRWGEGFARRARERLRLRTIVKGVGRRSIEGLSRPT
jgi:2-polyprenyl-6-methoxyphenol hydroxylase-like FAD-dependent oxidoreductase